MGIINFTKIIWDYVTHKINPANLNRIEQGIEDCANAINCGMVNEAGIIKANKAKDSERLGGKLPNEFEPAITKGTAFNKNFAGTGIADTVARSDHNHDNTYSYKNHNHDDRYYTENEINNLLSNKSSVGHTHPFSSITDKPSTISGYGIQDAYTKSQVDALVSSSGVPTVNAATVSNNPNNITSPGIYQGEWTSNKPASATSNYASIVVTQTTHGNTNYLRYIYMEESSNKMWTRNKAGASTFSSWKELGWELLWGGGSTYFQIPAGSSEDFHLNENPRNFSMIAIEWGTSTNPYNTNISFVNQRTSGPTTSEGRCSGVISGTGASSKFVWFTVTAGPTSLDLKITGAYAGNLNALSSATTTNLVIRAIYGYR